MAFTSRSAWNCAESEV